MAGFVEKEQIRLQKENTTNSAFIAWQLGAGAKKSFKLYLEGIGLGEKKSNDISEAEKKYHIKRAADLVKRVKKMKGVKRGKNII